MYAGVRKRTGILTLQLLLTIRTVYLYKVIQDIIILAIFIAALAYLGRIAFKSFQHSGECASGCGKCGAIDLKKIEQQLKEKGL